MSASQKRLQRAKEIVERYRERGCIFPRELRDRSDPIRQQEYRDACKIKTWKYSLLGKNKYVCCNEVRDYLDENMPGWRNRVYSHQGRSSSLQMQRARDIVQRYKERGNVLPQRTSDPGRNQEYKDAEHLGTWKSSLRGGNRVVCSQELRDYLDKNMPNWRDDRRRTEENHMTFDLPTSVNTRTVASTTMPEDFKINTPRGQMHSQMHSSEAGGSDRIKRLRDLHNVLMKAQEIVRRCLDRHVRGQNTLPRINVDQNASPVSLLEQIDASELLIWKRMYDAQGEEASAFQGGIPWELKAYLDTHLPEWKNIEREKAPAATPAPHGTAYCDNNAYLSSHNLKFSRDTIQSLIDKRVSFKSSSLPTDKRHAPPVSNCSAVAESNSTHSTDVKSLSIPLKKQKCANNHQNKSKGEAEGVAALLQLSNDSLYAKATLPGLNSKHDIGSFGRFNASSDRDCSENSDVSTSLTATSSPTEWTSSNNDSDRDVFIDSKNTRVVGCDGEKIEHNGTSLGLCHKENSAVITEKPAVPSVLKKRSAESLV